MIDTINTVKQLTDGYLVNGDSFVPNDERNIDYALVQKWIDVGGIVSPEFTAEELQKEAFDNFVSMTDTHIQAEVMKYNEANNVMFGSIHNCSTYVTVDTYPHQAFCISILKWNADVWEAVRTYQASQTALGVLPTEAEFQAVLDSVVFA